MLRGSLGYMETKFARVSRDGYTLYGIPAGTYLTFMVHKCVKHQSLSNAETWVHDYQRNRGHRLRLNLEILINK